MRCGKHRFSLLFKVLRWRISLIRRLRYRTRQSLKKLTRKRCKFSIQSMHSGLLRTSRGAQVAHLIDPETPYRTRQSLKKLTRKRCKFPIQSMHSGLLRTSRSSTFSWHLCRGRFSLTSPPSRWHQVLGLQLMQCLHHSHELT
jgi:hypothetical protein